MNRFFITGQPLSPGARVIIDDAQDVQHIRKVLRLQPGEGVEVCDGAGVEATMVIEAIDRDTVTGTVEACAVIRRESPLSIDLYQSLPKAQKMELILQKGTELGVTGFIPVAAERCVVKLGDGGKEQKKENRWQTIVDEAAKQCKRGCIPAVRPVVSLKEAAKALAGYDLVLLPHTGEGTRPLKQVLATEKSSRVAVFIGPEGGFTDAEVALLCAAGAVAVTLGPRILRTETAGLAVSSILQYAYGDMGE